MKIDGMNTKQLMKKIFPMNDSSASFENHDLVNIFPVHKTIFYLLIATLPHYKFSVK